MRPNRKRGSGTSTTDAAQIGVPRTPRRARPGFKKDPDLRASHLQGIVAAMPSGTTAKVAPAHDRPASSKPFCLNRRHGTEPYEQNTQQSPGFGRSVAPQPVQALISGMRQRASVPRLALPQWGRVRAPIRRRWYSSWPVPSACHRLTGLSARGSESRYETAP